MIRSDDDYLCECNNPQSFGKNCEYLLPTDTTFIDTLIWEINMRAGNWWKMQIYSDIVCYTTLICDSGLLCLDWRDICNGLQQCMSGYDEENCDKLEFNECEDDEYRCLNGMCIPDEYFLNGELDCLDLSDEKQVFDDTKCAFHVARYECDDRMCLQYGWSCGDGQCISNRIRFHTDPLGSCKSLRDQYHMCEMNPIKNLWTLPNGKCYLPFDYTEILAKNRSDLDKCVYFIKCILSNSMEKNCPCRNDFLCTIDLKNVCNSSIIHYPNGGVIAPFVFTYYSITRDWSEKIPDVIEVNGTIKCRGYIIDRHMTLNYSLKMNLHELQANMCYSASHIPVSLNIGYDRHCFNDSQTFNNRPYNFIDICNKSKECISAYRINDGYYDCADKKDESIDDLNLPTCLNIQRHRFRCSNEQPTCLPITVVGDGDLDCRNHHDELWMGTSVVLTDLYCDHYNKLDCELIRQYIETSQKIDTNNVSYIESNLTKLSFRYYCDTFWDMKSKKDENIEMCKKWWKCREDQWQCYTGQCIDKNWLLDQEWDCPDASDEEAIFASSNYNTTHNNGLISVSRLTKIFNQIYSMQPFGEFCDLISEYPCFRANASDPLNINHSRPCINLNQIGDGNIDCVGGLDERSSLSHCGEPFMLGYSFRCPLEEKCVPYLSQCSEKCNDNRIQCYGYNQTSSCANPSDITCLNGTCVENGWCNDVPDCAHGEDEYMCVRDHYIRPVSFRKFYRNGKLLYVRETELPLKLRQFPSSTAEKTGVITGPPLDRSTKNTIFDKDSSIIAYVCNRGVGIYLYNKSIVCFCPPQYYGDRCQFHNDRLTVLFHLNFSHSIYANENNLKRTLKLLVIFLYENQSLMIESFHILLTDNIKITATIRSYLLYSRSNISLHNKRIRYFNRSNIVEEHPYSVRIEAYELKFNEKVRLVAVWLYTIYFDFLPSFLLAKVLRFIEPGKSRNPCFSRPCKPQQECHQVLNQNPTYVCLCPPNFKGNDCSILDDMCKEGFCSRNALCRPNYRGLLDGNDRPYCICPADEIGDRCNLVHDKCDLNPCQNDGTCFPLAGINTFYCLCKHHYYGDECQYEKRSVQLYINESIEHQAAVVQYFNINLLTLNLILMHQHIYVPLPNFLHSVYNGEIVPDIIVVKLYSKVKNEIYLISVRIDMKSINGTTEVNEKTVCTSVENLFETREEISLFRYHQLCIENVGLLCFVDNLYLCICDENHNQAECFNYDHNLDQCSSCFSGGQCLKDNPSSSVFLCLCPQCYTGKSCQFNNEGLSFTLDLLLIEFSDTIRILYLILTLSIFFIGGIINYASVITFKRPVLRKTSIGIYILTVSIISQYSLFSLIMKIHLILFNILMNDISCKIISYMLSVTSQCSFWLMSLIAIERVFYLIFPFGTFFKKTHVAILISSMVLFIISIMNIHELIYYMKDPNENNACIINFPIKIRIYNRISTLVHYIIPFFIELLSITLLIVLAASSRSRAGANNHDTFIICLKRQFKSQKELYITPLVIILSGLPQAIFTFSFSCTQLISWQQHALLIAYFLSYTPQLLGFFLYVLPSTNYMKEFRATSLSKTFLFRLILTYIDK